MRLPLFFDRTIFLICASVLLVSCDGGGGEVSTTASAPPASNTSQVPPPAVLLKGEIRLAPGAQATVFWDVNDNWEVDPWEVTVTASASGQYEIAPRPSAEAVLRAQTRWLTPDAFGSYLGPVPLSALSGQENVMSPLTSLAQIAGLSVAQVESALGLSASSDDSANQLVNDVARAIAIQLRQRKGQLEVGEGATAARSILSRTKQLIDETNTRLAGAALKSSQLLQSQAIAKNSVSTLALNLPSFSKATYFSNRVSGFESYLWLIENQIQRTAVSKVLFEMQFLSKSAQGKGSGIIRFKDFDYYQMRRWVEQLTLAGIDRDDQEALWDSEQLKQKQLLDKAFETSATSARKTQFLDEGVEVISSRDFYINEIDAVFGYIAVRTGIPVNKAFLASEAVQPGEYRNALLLAKAMNCGTGIVPIRGEVITGDSERFRQLITKLTECIVDGNSTVRTFNILKTLSVVDLTSDLGMALFDAAAQPDAVKRRIAGFRVLAISLGYLSNIATDARVSGSFDMLAAALKAYADGMEIVDRKQGLYDEKLASIERSWREAYKEVERGQWARKLEYRLNRVIAYTPRSVKTGASLSCTPKPPLKASCSLGSLPALSLKTQSLTAGKPLQIQMAATNETVAGIQVSFGDGWTTANLPEFVGKAILPGTTLEHSYLTPGRYTVVATTVFANGESFRDESVVSVVNDTPTANGSCGSANGVAVAQSPSANLCSAGSAGSVAGTGPWSWNCTGTNGGTNASCSALLAAASTCIGQWDARPYQIGTVEEKFANTCPVGSTGQVRSFHTCQAGGAWSPVATSDNCTATLLAPSSASVASVSTGMQVTWNTVAGATGYNVYRDNSLVSNVSGGLTSSTINTSVSNGVRYCYAVEAVSTFTTALSVSARTSAGCATYSSGPAPLLAPSNVSAAQIPGGGLRVSWSLSSGADGYVLTRQNDNRTWDLSSSPTSYDDLSVTPGISYAYVVQAKRGTERSPQSLQGNAIVPSVPVSGACGSANGVAVAQSPSANLCSAGSAGSVAGAGPWSWSCSGTTGGFNASCSAPLAAPLVFGFSPKFSSRGTTVVVTVSGTGLPDTLAMAIANASCSNRGLFSSTTSQQFDCSIPSSANVGMALVTVKDRSGGSTLFQPSLSQGFEIK